MHYSFSLAFLPQLLFVATGFMQKSAVQQADHSHKQKCNGHLTFQYIIGMYSDAGIPGIILLVMWYIHVNLVVIIVLRKRKKNK